MAVHRGRTSTCRSQMMRSPTFGTSPSPTVARVGSSVKKRRCCARRTAVRRGHGALDIPGLHSAAKLDRIPTSTGVAVVDAGERTSGLTLASVRFADPQHGWIVGFFANMGRSMILRTVDGGTTWTIDADIDGEELRRIFALDPRHVWAIGQRTRPGKQAIYVRDPDAK